jgi:hypothetical protein
MPFGGMKSAQFGVGLGLVSLCTVAVLAVLAVRKRLLHSRASIVLFGCYLFSLFTALLTAAERMYTTDLTFTAAKPARYLILPLVTWAVFVLLCLRLSSKLPWRVASPQVITVIVASLLLLGLPKLRWWLQAQDDEYANEQLETLGLVDGLNDPSVMLKIFPDPPAVNVWLSGLRRRQLSIFYNGPSKWLGLPVRRFALPVTTVVPGEVTYTFPVISGVEVAGWADEFQLRGTTGWIVFTNESDQIVGFGRKVPAGFPTMVRSPRTPPSLGWVGFVNLRFPTKSFRAYVVNKRGLLAIQGSTPVPRDAMVSPAEVGPSIRSIQWQKDPSWTVNNLPPRVPFGPGPAGPVYSSWSGSDKNTGRISSSDFAAPVNACLILPIVNGVVATRLSTEILDADKNEVIATAPFQNGSRGWAFWRISIPARVKRLRITAEDRGTNWGEWLAIGTPKECR